MIKEMILVVTILAGIFATLAIIYAIYRICIFINFTERIKIKVDKNYLIIKEEDDDGDKISICAFVNYKNYEYLIYLNDSRISPNFIKRKLYTFYDYMDIASNLNKGIGYDIKLFCKSDILLLSKSKNRNFEAYDIVSNISYYGKVIIDDNQAYGILPDGNEIELDTESIFKLN